MTDWRILWFCDANKEAYDVIKQEDMVSMMKQSYADYMYYFRVLCCESLQTYFTGPAQYDCHKIWDHVDSFQQVR